MRTRSDLPAANVVRDRRTLLPVGLAMKRCIQLPLHRHGRLLGPMNALTGAVMSGMNVGNQGSRCWGSVRAVVNGARAQDREISRPIGAHRSATVNVRETRGELENPAPLSKIESDQARSGQAPCSEPWQQATILSIPHPTGALNPIEEHFDRMIARLRVSC